MNKKLLVSVLLCLFVTYPGFADQKSTLLKAAEKGDVGIVEQLLNDSLDVNTSDKNGRTALHMASKKGHLKVVRLLVERGADVFALDNKSRTPLDYALSKNKKEVVWFLREYRDWVNAESQITVYSYTSFLKNYPNSKFSLSDQLILAEIAKTSDDKDVCKIAIDKVSDQSLLFEIAKANEDVEIRQKAIKKINIEKILANIAITEPDWHARVQTFTYIKDQALIADIAKARLITVADIQSGLVELEVGEEMREELRTGIKVYVNCDGEILSIGSKDKSVVIEYKGIQVHNLSELAVLRLTDQSILIDVAKNAFHRDARCLAVKQITDQNILADIAKNDEDEDVRSEAQRRLKELKK